MPKFQGKKYETLSEGTKKRLSSALEKVHKSGFTMADYEKMNDKDFAKHLDIKLGVKTKYGYQNVYSYRKLFRQAKGTAERKTQNISKTIIKYKKEGWKGKGLEKMRRELTKTSGATFLDVYDQVKKKHPELKTISDRQEYSRQLLMIPAQAIDDLSIDDQETILGYDTSP